MHKIAVAIACTSIIISVPSLAKDRPAGGGPPSKPAVSVVDNGTDHDPNFSDPGNHTARSIAKMDGISVADAKTLLRAQRRSVLLIENLSTQFPDTFLGVRFDRGPGKIRVLFTDDDVPQEAVSEAARVAGMSGSIEVAPAAMSRRAERELMDRLLAELRQAGRVDVDFTIDPENGVVTLSTPEDAELRTLVEETGGSLVHNIRFDPGIKIVQTTYSIAGQAWNAPSGTYPLCTTGFSVYHTTLAVYGATTAGHCDVNSPSEFNIYMDTGYGDGGGNNLTFRQQWITDGLDIQFHTLAESDDETAPYYWNGTSSIPVASTHKVAPEPSTRLCKWGRTTRWSCGNVGATTCSGTYGCGFYLITGMSSQGGDSGGPVVQGQTAYGWIHGVTRDGSAAVYLTIQQVYRTPLRLTICVPGQSC